MSLDDVIAAMFATPIPPPVAQMSTTSASALYPALYPASKSMGTSGAFALHPAASSGTSGASQIDDIGMNRFSPTLAGAVAIGISQGAVQGVTNPFRQNGGLSQK